MTCCGGKIKRAVNTVSAGVEKAAAIVKGNALHTFDGLYLLPKEKYAFADTRLATCRVCDKSTWMTRQEYASWLWEHKIEVIRHIEDLSVLPELPKQEYRKGRLLFCRVCKCWLPAKTFVKDKKCPNGLWPS